MTTAKKNKPSTPDLPLFEPMSSGDRLILGPVRPSKLYCHSPECEGDHTGTGLLEVYLHWEGEVVVLEPHVRGLDNYRTDMLEKYYPESWMIRQVIAACPLVQFLRVEVLELNGGYHEAGD